MLENWLNHPKVEEDYQRNAIMKDRKGNLQEGKSPEEIKKKEKKLTGSSSKNLQQGDCQESKRDLHQKSQPGDRIDKETMELRGLIERSSKEIREYCNGKIGGTLQCMIWRQGKKPTTVRERKHQIQQQVREASGHL
jgi:hypothetical protein